LTLKKVKREIKKGDFLLTADEAKKLGIVDEVY
jgi:hypothetical protein